MKEDYMQQSLMIHFSFSSNITYVQCFKCLLLYSFIPPFHQGTSIISELRCHTGASGDSLFQRNVVA